MKLNGLNGIGMKFEMALSRSIDRFSNSLGWSNDVNYLISLLSKTDFKLWTTTIVILKVSIFFSKKKSQNTNLESLCGLHINFWVFGCSFSQKSIKPDTINDTRNNHWMNAKHVTAADLRVISTNQRQRKKEMKKKQKKTKTNFILVFVSLGWIHSGADSHIIISIIFFPLKRKIKQRKKDSNFQFPLVWEQNSGAYTL